MRNNKNKEFYEAPANTKDVGILNKGRSSYGKLEDVDGKQPYYWNQGIGDITGIPQDNIVHNGINVFFDGIQVIKER